MKPSMTATRPALMPAISLPPDAAPFVAEADADEPVAVPEAAAADVLDGAAVVVATLLLARAWLSVGSAGLPLTNQPPDVELGQAGGVTLAVL